MFTTVFYTPEEMSKLLKVSKITIYKLFNRGELTGCRVGHSIRTDGSDLEVYIRRAHKRAAQR